MFSAFVSNLYFRVPRLRQIEERALTGPCGSGKEATREAQNRGRGEQFEKVPKECRKKLLEELVVSHPSCTSLPDTDEKRMERPPCQRQESAEFICAGSMHWTLPSRARRHRQRHSKPANVASFTLRVSLRPEAMKATLSIEATTSADRWLHLWSTPDLATRTTIEWSPRLTRSLGRCYPERRLIRLAAFLEESENALLEEVPLPRARPPRRARAPRPTHPSPRIGMESPHARRRI